MSATTATCDAVAVMSAFRTRGVETRNPHLAALKDVVYATWALNPGAAHWTTREDVAALDFDPATVAYRDLCELVVLAAHANMEDAHGRKIADVADARNTFRHLFRLWELCGENMWWDCLNLAEAIAVATDTCSGTGRCQPLWDRFFTDSLSRASPRWAC